MDFPFTIQTNFLTIESITQSSRQEPIIKISSDDSIQDLICFFSTIYEEYNLSPNAVDISSFDNRFLETDIAERKIFKGS